MESRKNVLIFANNLTNDLELQGLKVWPLSIFSFSHLLMNISHNNNQKVATENSPHPIRKTDTLLPSWNHLRPESPQISLHIFNGSGSGTWGSNYH